MGGRSCSKLVGTFDPGGKRSCCGSIAQVQAKVVFTWALQT